MLSNFGTREKKKKKKINPPSFLKNKSKFIPLPITSMRPNLAAFISDEWEAALTEECECKFILDWVCQNTFPLPLTDLILLFTQVSYQLLRKP